MSTGILLVLGGILLQVIDLPVDIGFMTINLLSDIVAYALMLLGIRPFLNEQNLLFKKAFGIALTTLIIEIFSRLSTCLDFGKSNTTVSYLFFALTALNFMRFIYYYTECLLLQAKFLKTEVNIPQLRGAFSAFSILIIAHYLVCTLIEIAIITTAATIILALCAVYYCSTINTVRLQLYPDKKAVE